MAPKQKAGAAPAAAQSAKGGQANATQPTDAPAGARYVKSKDNKGNDKWKLTWRSTTKQPRFVDRNLELLEGERYSRRPSAQARKAGKRRGTDLSGASAGE